MSKKQEIKVYLPQKLVGELEERRRAGVRSKFIEKSVRKALQKEDEFDLWDVEWKELLRFVQAKAMSKNDKVLHAVLTDRLEALQ